MNRILFETSEIKGSFATFTGERAAHVMTVLHGEVGQILKTGEINGPIGTSEIVSLEPGVEGSGRITVRVCHDKVSLAPWVDLILAPPRPRVLKRLLPQLATMGVGRIVLVGARKVEKDFWGATLLKTENYRPLLVEGLMQAGTSILPTIETRRNWGRFLSDELETMFPSPRRLVAHPYAANSTAAHVAERADGNRDRLVLAIGPEGGWTDEEVARLEAKGFARYSLGERILRTDTATIALLSRLEPIFGTSLNVKGDCYL